MDTEEGKPQESPKSSAQVELVDLVRRLMIESIARAAVEQRHGRDEIHITYHNGEVRQIEFVPRTIYR